jgi:ABC-type branched-subunit amino acid transport system permease subunit
MKIRIGLIIAIFMAFLISVPFFASDYWVTLLVLILIFTVYASGWNLFQD